MPFVDTTVFPVTNFDVNPVGSWSTIFVARPVFSPSLYTVNLYTTSSPVFTVTGSFLCLYVAVPSVAIVLVSIFGTLVFATVVPPTLTIYFLNAKSTSLVSFVLSIKTIGCVFSTAEFVYNVIFDLEYAVPFSYDAAFAFAVFIKYLYNLIACSCLYCPSYVSWIL